MIEPGQIWVDKEAELWGLLVLERGRPLEGEAAWLMLVLWDNVEPRTVGTAELTRVSFLEQDFQRML